MAEQIDLRALVAQLIADQRSSWSQGVPHTLGVYLAQYPEIAADSNATVALIASELQIRRELGHRTDAAEYYHRFPHLRELLSKRLGSDSVDPVELIGHSDQPGDPYATRIPTPGLLPTIGLEGSTEEPPVKPLRQLHVRCPHCNSRIDVAADCQIGGILCGICGSEFSLISTVNETRLAREKISIGHFDLIEQLGSGSFGTVWKARDNELDRTVAVKIPRKGQLSPFEVEQFFREARASAQLRHPNIVGIYEVGRSDDSIYIVSEFIKGCTLADLVQTHPLIPRESAELLAKVAGALHHAHERGVIHRDLKPGNILIDERGTPHVADFGLAKRKSGEVTMTLDGQVLGTPAYMSPEQARGEGHQADARSDVYSLGVILYQLLARRLPFQGAGAVLMSEILHRTPPRLRSIQKNIPCDLETICLKCLEKEAPHRYQTAGDLQADLERYLNGKSIHARRTPLVTRAWRSIERNPIYALHSVLTFLGGVGAAKLFFSLLLLALIGSGYTYFASNPLGGVGNLVAHRQETDDNVPQTDKNIGSEAKAEEDRRKAELAKNAPKQAFAEFLAADEFKQASDILNTSPVFSDAEKAANRLQLQNGWHSHADQAFLARDYETAAGDYAALVKEFPDPLLAADLNLMQARSRLGAGDPDTARTLVAGLSPPTQRQNPRDRVFFLVNLVLAEQGKSPAGIDELHAVWKEHHNQTAVGATTGSEADIWTAKPFEIDQLETTQSAIVANWLQTADSSRAPQNEAELKKTLGELTKILDMDPKNVDAWVVKGNIHLALKQWPEVSKAVKQRLALKRLPALQALRDRARVLDACYDLTNVASDERTLNSALASVPQLMRFKNAQPMLAGSVHSLAERLPKYLPAAVEALRATAESSGAEPDLRPLFAILLAKDIRRRLAEESEFAAKADQFLKDCAFINEHGGGADEVIRACQAEALLALNQEGALQVLGAPGTTPYYQYVKARALSRMPDSAADLRTTLAALFSQPPAPELRQANRIKLAFEALEQLLSPSLASGASDIAQALKPGDPKLLDATYDLLRSADGWKDANASLSDVARAHLASAAWWHPTKKDERLARDLTGNLVAEWQKNLNDEILDPPLVYHLYYTYLEAHRTAGDKPTQEANLAVVDRLLSLTKKKKLDDGQVQAFYRKVVAPFEPAAANLKNHRFFARTAEVVADAAHLDWGFADASGRKLSVNDKLEGLFTSAVNLSAAKEPQYFLARGRVRLNRKPFDVKAVLADAEALRRHARFEASAYTLAGHAHFYQSRQEPTHAARLKALDESLKILRQALPSGDPGRLNDDQQAERLLLLSYVHLERRNFAGWDTSAVNDFEKAADYALQAEKFLKGAALEHAYSAAGNAFEDLAWYTRSDVEPNYQKAVENFRFAIRANPASVAARLNLGRCYYKMAAVSGVSPPGVGTLREIVVKAEGELREAIKIAESQSHENPEAHYWLGKVLQVKHLEEGTSVEKAKQRLNAAEFRAADDELLKALDLAVKQNLADNALRLFAVELAENVLLHPDFYRDKSANNVALAKVAARADELKKLNLPRTTGVDLDQEVKVLNARAKLLADSGLAALGELDEAARDLRQMDADKASASDAKIMELRFEVFADLRPRELTNKVIEDWLNEAIWYARLPRTIVRKDPTSVLITARNEAEKARSDVAGETLFTAFEPAWLQAAIESSPRDKRLSSWCTELLDDFERQVRAAGNNAKELALVANRIATRLERLIDFLDKRGRGGEADQLRAHAGFYRKMAN